MKNFILLCLSILNLSFIHAQNNPFLSKEADNVLNRTYNTLNGIKNIRYTHTRELNYTSEHYRNISKWNVYYDFQSADTIIGFKYQIEDTMTRQFFNGTEEFSLDKKNKTIQINDSPKEIDFGSFSALYNSLLTLKNILPILISDTTAIKTVTDTTITGNIYRLVTVNIGKRRIQNLGKGFDSMSTKSDFIYKILIGKNNYLPLEILQQNNINNDFIKTCFSDITVNIPIPADTTWYYSTYLSEYKPEGETAVPQLLPNGSWAPQWELVAYKENNRISLHDLKGKVVLLDFWIKNCGPCILSVAYLNKLQQKFSGKNFKIISINSYDPKEEVDWFYNKHKIDYTVVLKGNAIAEEYGVSGFPTFFLIDKTGKILYSCMGFDEATHSKLEQLISNAL